MPKIIGISGGSGSGKTTLANRLGTNLMCPVLSMDDFYYPISQQVVDSNGFHNFDLPTALNLDKFAEVLQLLKDGNSVEIEEYHFNNPNKKPSFYAVNAGFPYIIVEGIFLFSNKDIFQKLDFSIFVDTPLDVMFQRRLTRDIRDRAITPETVHYQWDKHFAPAYRQYVYPSKTFASLAVDGVNSIAIAQIIAQLPTN